MNKTFMLLSMCLLLAGCNNTKTINGVTYDVYGLANMDDKKNPNIEYEISTGSVITAVIFSETVIIPLYIVGVDLWQPVGPKPAIKGAVND
jgi:predicted small secreted protein